MPPWNIVRNRILLNLLAGGVRAESELTSADYDEIETLHCNPQIMTEILSLVDLSGMISSRGGHLP